MRSKFAWFASAAVLSLVLWIVGLAGMVSKSLEYLFETEDRWAIAEQGGAWIMLASLGLGFVLMTASLIALTSERRRLGRVLHDLATQCLAVMCGGIFAWTVAQDAKFLVFAVPLYALMHLEMRKSGWHEPERPWRHWTLHALTASTAGYVLLISLP